MDYKLLEKQIRDNSEDLKAYVNSFHNWEEEMRKKDEELLRLKSGESMADEGNVENDEDDNILKHEKANSHKNKGNTFVKKGKWKQAIEEYTTSIELYPDDAVYYGNRSYCYVQLKLWEAAEKDCDRALELKPDYLKVILRRANIRKEIGNIHGAAKDYNLVLILDPKNSVAFKEYEEIYPELKNNLSEIGINLPEFNEMNPSKTLQEDESKQSDDSLIAKIGKNIKAKSSKTCSPKINKINTEVTYDKNSSKCLVEDSGKSDNYSVVYPTKTKPAHLRSKQPLRRIQIDDVYLNSNDEFAI
uniref:TPR_REGION domain-containing protein n=1 Tax=Rhodnius prolixus TaxID=13249 RepID=T1HXC1_RHOPR